ncbi:hypothetical protein DFJ74DRAFT_760038 [Hyaloraphidium curvatum]|nr:hypothetical protein DFJ74DRAFT_760038 [Hyaloraphidium curvatum]
MLVVNTALALSVVMFTWTTIATYGARFWSTGWGAALGALALFVNFGWSWGTGCTRRIWLSVPQLRLSERLRHRAMDVALTSMLERFRSGLRGDAEEAARAIMQDDGYLQLHTNMAATWEAGIAQNNMRWGFLTVSIVVQTVNTIVNLAAGSCIIWAQLWIFPYLLVRIGWDLVNLAVGNSQIAAVTSLLSSARRELRALIVFSDRLPPDSAREALVRAAAHHEALLGSLVERGTVRGRFMGFAVDAGVIRTFYATVFTLAVGLFSVMRGWVFVTLEGACPLRP